jgi:predicted nucleotidyltransferase
MGDREEQLRGLIAQIVATVQPLRVILFGSAAKGVADADSDFDLLIVMPEGTHRRHTAERLYRTITDVTIPFDLLVATPGDLEKHRDNPGLIYRTVLEEGRTLYAA